MDFNIFCTDTVIGPTCDDKDNAILGTDSLYTTFFKAKIKTNDTIDLGVETRIRTKK